MKMKFGPGINQINQNLLFGQENFYTEIVLA